MVDIEKLINDTRDGLKELEKKLNSNEFNILIKSQFRKSIINDSNHLFWLIQYADGAHKKALYDLYLQTLHLIGVYVLDV